MTTTELNFLPSMTLETAARIAHAHGLELRVFWNGKVMQVKAVKPPEEIHIPSFLLHPMQAGG